MLIDVFLRVVLARGWGFLNSVIDLGALRLSNKMSLAVMALSETKGIVHRSRAIIIVVCEDFAGSGWDGECGRCRIHICGSMDSLF